jgi:hypothetical protein
MGIHYFLPFVGIDEKIKARIKPTRQMYITSVTSGQFCQQVLFTHLLQERQQTKF